MRENRMQRLWKLLALVMAVGAATGLSSCLVDNTPRAEFTAMPEVGYPPLSVTFNASASTSPNGLIVSYAWDFGDDTTAEGVTASHTYAQKGLYEVTLTVRDSTGATGERTKAVQALNRAPVARFKTNVYSTGVRQPVWFDASESEDSDGEIVDYFWDFGDGEVSEGVLVQHAYASAHGSGWRPTITLTVTDEDGASDFITHEIVVAGCDACGG